MDAVVRILNAILDAINISKKRKASNDPATAISNGGRVHESAKKFTDLAAEPRDDEVE